MGMVQCYKRGVNATKVKQGKAQGKLWNIQKMPQKLNKEKHKESYEIFLKNRLYKSLKFDFI